MTTMMNRNAVCSVCGQESQHRVVMSTNTFGACDLDLRPAEMKRSTMNTWVQECPHCGYVGVKLETPLKANREFLDSSTYRNCGGRNFRSELAKRFFKRYLLDLEEKGEAHGFHSAVYAAWACDDAEDLENAVYCRNLAVSCLRSKMKAEPENEVHKVVEADLLRRAGRMDELLARYGEVTLKDRLLQQILRFQLEKARQNDTQCYTVDHVTREDAAKA